MNPVIWRKRSTAFVRAAEDLFTGARLPAPMLPAYLAEALEAHSSKLWSTRPLQTSPYALDHYLDELDRNPSIAPYAIVGFDGHGVNSWSVHYYVVSDAAALFIQLPWGGAYLDKERARSDISGLFVWASSLQDTLQRACDAGNIPPGCRLQVAASAHRVAGWRWWLASRDNTDTPWRDPVGMKAELLCLAKDLLEGRRSDPATGWLA
jgi:hypothetical protein